MFQPIIPIGGIGGWNFLQSTYDRQLGSFADSAQVRNDVAYMEEKLSGPIAQDDFLNDRRLLRTTLTAFGLGGEEWKRGFIDKVLSEAADPESTFLARLNNPQYSDFAEAFRPVNGTISVTQGSLADLMRQFETASFQTAVGEVDNDMRLSLNYQAEIDGLTRGASSDRTVLFRVLGNVPVRTVLESAMNLPSEVRSLPLERQADMFQERISSVLGISDLSELASEENIGKVIRRFHAVQSITQGPSPTAPGSTALTLLTGVGSGASQNLFLSSLI